MYLKLKISLTLENFLNIHNLVPDLYGNETKVLVTRFNDLPFEKYADLAATLRDAGITTMSYLGTKKFGKQIDYAVRSGCTHVVIMGSSEAEAGIVKVKNLATREETEVALANIADFFK